jgi:acyl-CoA synthetase (AMP-forming)/AMP-acid ligase II
MEIEFGCVLAGLVRVAVNFRLADEEILRTLQNMDARAVVYAGRRTPLLDAALDTIPGLVALRLVLDESDETSGPGAVYEAALARAKGGRNDENADPEHLCSLFCSSGTTGAPKGIMLTRRAQLAVATNMMVELGPVLPGDGVALPQPLSHGAGFFMLPYFLSGGRCVVVEAYDPVGLYETAARHRACTIKLVPMMLREMLDAGVAPEEGYRPGRIIYGAAPMPREVVDRGREVFGEVMMQIYGQGEVPICVTVLTESDHADPATAPTTGRPWRGVDVRVTDRDGHEVEPGEEGEVVVRGAHAMTGYWRDPEQTARVIRDGAIHTNDRATVSELGYVTLLGRMDDIINSGGFNVPSVVVEQVLNEHPAVLEAAVKGVPDERFGERVAAFVVLREGCQASPEEIIGYCRPRLGMQRPRSVDIISALPRNAYGKVDKARLGLSVAETDNRGGDA